VDMLFSVAHVRFSPRADTSNQYPPHLSLNRALENGQSRTADLTAPMVEKRGKCSGGDAYCFYRPGRHAIHGRNTLRAPFRRLTIRSLLFGDRTCAAWPLGNRAQWKRRKVVE